MAPRHNLDTETNYESSVELTQFTLLAAAAV